MLLRCFLLFRSLLQEGQVFWVTRGGEDEYAVRGKRSLTLSLTNQALRASFGKTRLGLKVALLGIGAVILSPFWRIMSTKLCCCRGVCPFAKLALRENKILHTHAGCG